jgi:2-polyprenyl-3-methyl-5-hydroxy-6-metoxy-1,4-benzoquinol methylase
MFSSRSYTKELLDEPVIEKSKLYRNLKELEIINRYLGGHNISIGGVSHIVTDKSKTYHIADIGCGGGDSLKAIAKWAEGEGYNVRLTGIDLKQDCITYAQENCKQYSQIKFVCDDFRNIFLQAEKPDIVHASLFCHHFTENEIVESIHLCAANKAIFIINDLERNPIAHYSIKLLTKLFSKSDLVKNDAPLSVLRGFKKVEWASILKQAGVKNYILKNKWAFRHLVIIYPQ